MSIEIFESDFEGVGVGEEEEEAEECIEWNLEVQQTRSMAYIIDYKMFIAARRIQSLWRGHRERKLRDQRWRAAIAIQRLWRGFRLRRQLWHLFERRLQEAYLDHLNLMATRIQALFRGWYERRHVHDMQRLTRVQTIAIEELIYCLIQNLHHLKRTECLPGIVSVQESFGTSKTDHILTVMAFRFYNGQMASMVHKQMARQEENRRQFRECCSHTRIPYAGPDFCLCAHYTDKIDVVVENAKNDPRLYDIATEYQAFQRCKYLKELQLHSGSQKREECLQNIRDREKKVKESFCNTVIRSMRGWAIWHESNLGIKDILQQPGRRERFFKKLGMVLEENGIKCNCTAFIFPVYHCSEAHNYTGRAG
ncbi:uncharacterized protein [Drosophila kikkawai]|uniref:Uncharacterized protein isoform X2 n=1 Tax=Drosophila kikkawai TaxID=30033 RepID=A0A6P4IJZ5_DROKI|nr:uncharacterized protein LOC108075812 isoform X2 [Drosophila kikkawai]